MSTLPKSVGGKRKGTGTKGRGRGRKGPGSKRQNQNQNQNQSQNQQGGSCGNSSSVAAAYGGSVPNVPQGAGMTGGSALYGNAFVKGGNAYIKGGNSIIPPPSQPSMQGGNILANILPQSGGNVVAPLVVPPQAGGNVLNDLAVPAVLLYANNTFGKKKFSGKRSRKYRNKSRRNRRR
jgi:hypothetical protein